LDDSTTSRALPAVDVIGTAVAARAAGSVSASASCGVMGSGVAARASWAASSRSMGWVRASSYGTGISAPSALSSMR
jgi:hypothetical protein